jgi:hypothetical protein
MSKSAIISLLGMDLGILLVNFAKEEGRVPVCEAPKKGTLAPGCYAWGSFLCSQLAQYL